MYNQKIFFGAPGTGKSHYVNELISNINSDRIFRITIHPEYSYTDFIGQILPIRNSTGTIDFEFQPGPFTRSLVKAFEDTSKEVVLVLEEISRGNTAAIFGDIFQLLDRDKYFKSKFPIRNKQISDLIISLTTDEIYLPSNLSIFCTVNLNDQNVFPMDTAFKRRFDWEYISSSPIKDNNGNIKTKLNNPKIKFAIEDQPNNIIETNWLSFYTSLNLFITDRDKGLGKNEDKQIGQFFIEFNNQIIQNSYSLNDDVSIEAQYKIINILKNKLLLYLWQDIQGNQTYNSKRIFHKGIKSFDNLFSDFGELNVFSDDFIELFLKPNHQKYPY